MRFREFNATNIELWERYLRAQRPWEDKWLHWTQRDGSWHLDGQIPPPPWRSTHGVRTALRDRHKRAPWPSARSVPQAMESGCTPVNDPRSGRWQVFDSHLHIIDPRFPLVPNHGFVPDAFTVTDYLHRVAGLGVTGGAVVSGSFQGDDQTYLLDALHRLGPGFIGVTQLPTTVSDAYLQTLHAAGVRAVRVNLVRGHLETIHVLDTLAHRVHEVVGWHTELYVDSRDLPDLERQLCALPQISIDHLGLSSDGFSALRRLVARGVQVKATGFGRVDFDVPAALRELAAINPHALMFGTDLPSTRARRPFADRDIHTLVDALGEDNVRLALHDNALALYRPPITETA